MAKPSILIVGVGNDFRGDDAVGLEVVRQLQGQFPEGTVIREHSGEGMSLMESWKEFEQVFIVDAVSTQAKPGSLVFHDAAANPLPPQLFSCSTHHLGVAEAVELSRSMGTLPEKLFIVGIEGKQFGPGQPLSEEILSVLKERVVQITHYIIQTSGGNASCTNIP